MTEPTTPLHYTANGNFVNGQYAPDADGFNMADISSASVLSEVPSGDKALVYLGMTGGVTAVQGGRHAVRRQLAGLWLLSRRRTEPERGDRGQLQSGVRLDPCQ
jgi:hypothetical protein